MRLAWLGVIFNNRRSRRLGSRIIIIIKALEPIKRGSVTCSTRKHKHKQPRATIIINISKVSYIKSRNENSNSLVKK